MSDIKTFCCVASGGLFQGNRRGGEKTHGVLVIREFRAEVGEVREERVVRVDFDLRAEMCSDGVVKLGLIDKEKGFVAINETVREEYCRMQRWVKAFRTVRLIMLAYQGYSRYQNRGG